LVKSESEFSPIGSSFEDFLEEDGLLATVDEVAIKEVIAWQVNRLLDPANTGVSMHTLYRAAAVLGKTLRIELVDREPADH
jgi:hypothetical protein